jgi:diguanylate cyclase (GGDEF)-like protein/PAS domain S-box-containing protein
VSVLSTLAFAAAVVSLWYGARRHTGTVARGYRWLGGAALLGCAGLIVTMALAGSLSSSGAPLSLADVAPLLSLGAFGIGMTVLGTDHDQQNPHSGSVLPGLADGYVMAVALLVIGWVVGFGDEFHRSGERPGTFLLDLLHPLTDLAVLGALLPLLTTAWRRLLLPYLSLAVLTFADSLGVGTRVYGGHAGILQQLAMIAAAILLGAGPWATDTTKAPWHRDGAADRSGITNAGAATIVAAASVVVAALALISSGLANGPATGLALVIAGGAAVLVLAARVLMLVRDNAVAVRIWHEASKSVRDLADRTSDVVLICDLTGTISYASPAVAEYGYDPVNLRGQRLESYLHPEDRDAVVAAARGALTGESPESGRLPVRVRAADGTWRHVEGTVLRYRVPGQPDQMLVTARDISDEVALRQQVTHLTFHDGLTGLPNRAYVEERARDVLRSGHARSGVIFLDLDGFTAVNDSVGHGAGDLVLAQAARRLRAAVPAHDTVARWGGDEFAVLVEGAANTQSIAEIAERLVGTIASEPFQAAGRQITMSASVGVALADGDQPGLVLRNADVAMARAKDSGGGRVEVYAAHMHADVVRRLELASDLQKAITTGQLTLEYQPVVELSTSRVTGAEALVRWWRGGDVVPPREFLAVAEDTGLIVPLGEWVLRETCTQGAAWRAASWDVGVSVNVSLRQLNAPGFVARVAAVLAETGLEPAALTVEVNERVLVEDAGQIVEHLAALRALGVRLAIDDFGTGYASLAHLRQLPIDIIKIDPSFVAGLGQDETLTLLTRTIVTVGSDLGMQVVAEGIEQPRQLAALREMGCGYGQGFLVARPMAAPGVESLIRTATNGVSHAEMTTEMI